MKIIVLVLGLLAACANPVGTSAISQDVDGYCTSGFVGKIACNPDDGDGYCAQACLDYNGESGYCPEWTQGELDNCQYGCFTAWGLGHCNAQCRPAYYHYCILGERP